MDNSTIQLPRALEVPKSPITDQRLAPMFTNRSGSYWPVGAFKLRLAPITRSCLYVAKSFMCKAGAPQRFTARHTRASVMPSTFRVMRVSPEVAPPCRKVYGV